MTILITGQLGYIGSHVAHELAYEKGYEDFIGLDNLHTGLNSNNMGACVIGDIRNKEDIKKIFEDHDIQLVMHLAALTSVPESMEKKEEYEAVNTEGTINLLKVMKKHRCTKMIFSSTASIYKQSQEPLKETDVLQPLNHYALTKHWSEQIISRCEWLDYVIFRYFNVIGYGDWFDKSRELAKTNIVPALLRTIKNEDIFEVYGNCYPVKRENPEDHTCVRDYIDVRDIAKAHVMAIDYLENHKGCKQTFNLGTKNGSSVLEVLDAFEQANSTKISYIIKEPRKGDPASLIADNRKARELLKWEPQYTLVESLKVL
jgi:UDP-glucose 4-epimerase